LREGDVSEERFIRIETKIDVLQADVKQLKTDVDWLKVELKEVKTDANASRSETNRRLDKVEVNQELMRDDIKHLAEGQAAIVDQIAREFREMRQYIDDRLVPLEVAVRQLYRDRPDNR
jgi:outer membrane murein-binding lipoprotein Lpp